MKLSEIVHPMGIVTELESTERDAVISDLLNALIAADVFPESLKDEIIRSVLEREERGSTGFGKGVAVPHVKHDKIECMTAAVGVSQPGIDFNALDKQPVHAVFLLLSPADKPDEHLQAMEAIFKNLSQDTFRRFLRQATSAEDVTTLLAEADGDSPFG